MLKNLRITLEEVDKHSNQISENSNWTYTVNEDRMVCKKTEVGQKVTNCKNCNVTCHKRCCYDDKDKDKCCAMDGRTGIVYLCVVSNAMMLLLEYGR